MRRYFREAPAADAAWALWFLTGRRPKRLLGVRALVGWTLELTGTPDWLFGECYAVVGDLAECIALLLDDGTRVTHPDETPLSEWMEQRILPLRGLDAGGAAGPRHRLVAGAGPPRAVPPQQAAHRRAPGRGLGDARPPCPGRGGRAPSRRCSPSGRWETGRRRPSSSARILAREHGSDDASRPYPFFLASPLEDAPESLGDRSRWQVEWKWDGIRGAARPARGPRLPLVARRGARHRPLPRGGRGRASTLPDGTVLDGEVLAYGEDRPLPFALLQTRIGRQTLDPEDPRRGTGGVHGLRPARARGGRTSASGRCPSGARGWRRLARRAAPPVLRLRGARRSDWDALARRRAGGARAEGRGADAQAARVAVPHRPHARRLVEVEDRSLPGRRGAALRPPGQRPAREPVHRLHLRRVGRRAAGADRQGLLRAERRGDPPSSTAGCARTRSSASARCARSSPTQVFELHFEGIARSTRHKSGVARAFPAHRPLAHRQARRARRTRSRR